LVVFIGTLLASSSVNGANRSGEKPSLFKAVSHPAL
jgi:hypothetical protein